jgi:hypothetical protein
MEMENLAQEEFYKMLKIFRDIEFAHGKAIDMLFGYKLLDLKREEDLGKDQFRDDITSDRLDIENFYNPI